jgi:hypothetical protein
MRAEGARVISASADGTAAIVGGQSREVVQRSGDLDRHELRVGNVVCTPMVSD